MQRTAEPLPQNYGLSEDYRLSDEDFLSSRWHLLLVLAWSAYGIFSSIHISWMGYQELDPQVKTTMSTTIWVLASVFFVFVFAFTGLLAAGYCWGVFSLIRGYFNPLRKNINAYQRDLDDHRTHVLADQIPETDYATWLNTQRSLRRKLLLTLVPLGIMCIGAIMALPALPALMLGRTNLELGGVVSIGYIMCLSLMGCSAGVWRVLTGRSSLQREIDVFERRRSEDA